MIGKPRAAPPSPESIWRRFGTAETLIRDMPLYTEGTACGEGRVEVMGIHRSRDRAREPAARPWDLDVAAAGCDDQLFDALCAHPRDAAVSGTASLTSITGTTLTSFQKLYFETNETITLGSLVSTKT
jgi:hypothetical protein